MDRPLTKEQSDFAALHHGLVYAFLGRYRYPVDEFYDVAVFGYLGAVRDRFEQGLSAKYEFSTIAFRRMKFRVTDGIRERNRMKRKAEVFSYSEDTDKDIRADRRFDPEVILLSGEAAAKLKSTLTRRQSTVIRLKASGYGPREIAKRLGMPQGRVEKELCAAGGALREYARELSELAA
jgi:RNA polymerase sigma factor (sigma-70 family)